MGGLWKGWMGCVVLVMFVVILGLSDVRLAEATVPVQEGGQVTHGSVVDGALRLGEAGENGLAQARRVPHMERLVRRNARRWGSSDLAALGLDYAGPLDTNERVARQGIEGGSELPTDSPTPSPSPSPNPASNESPTPVPEESVASVSNDEEEEGLDIKGGENDDTTMPDSGGFSAVTIGIAVVLGVAVIGLVAIGVSRYRGYRDVEASMPFNQA